MSVDPDRVNLETFPEEIHLSTSAPYQPPRHPVSRHKLTLQPETTTLAFSDDMAKKPVMQEGYAGKETLTGDLRM